MSHYSLSALASDLTNGIVTGFTVDTVRREPVTAGCAVGGHPSVPSVVVKNFRAVPPAFLAMMLEQYARAADLEGHAIMGGWVEGADFWIDAPTIFMSREDAGRVARERGELAYFDLDTMTEYTVNR